MNDTTALQLPTMALYLGGALAAGMAGLVALGWFIDMQKHVRKWMLALIYPVIILAMSVGALLSNRNVTNAELEILEATGMDTPAATWILRAMTMFILCVCLARLISVSQTPVNRGREGRALFLAFILFYVTNMVLNNIFGIKPTFDQKFIYPLLIFVTFYFSRNKDINYAIDSAKLALLLFLVGSCAAVAALPQLALQRGYGGWLPGLSMRLWGLGSNPNSIGPLALLFLLLVTHKPFASRLIQYVAVAAGLAVLVLSQSKTAWASAMVAFPVLWWSRLVYAPAAALGARRQTYRLRQFSSPILVCLLGLAAVAAGVIYVIYFTEINSFANKEDVSTLTGRTAIWDIAIETWQRNPLFGYGSTMWDAEFRRMIDMNFAFNAHNQFMQTLSTAGLVGMAGLAVYFLVLLRYAVAANRETRGLALALFAFILVRCFTEAPFNMSTIYSGEFMTQLLLFSLVVNKGRQRVAAPYWQDPVQLHQVQWR